MTLLQCKKCSHFTELEGAAPEDLKCPKCGTGLDVSADRVEPTSETVEVGPGPSSRRFEHSAILHRSGRGDIFGNYRVVDEISRGAMGIVYRAEQVNLKRIVALKLLMAGERASQDQIERFYRETQAVAKLRHPNIIPIYDMGIVGERHYFTMEYVEGKSLEEIIGRSPISQEQALDIVVQVGKALAHAHERGIIHRDVKPGNILMDKTGHVRVTDFGLAKEIKKGRNVTRSGVTVGTPHYMSPEQACGGSAVVDQRTDVYSLGAVLYELLTGRPPYDGDTPVEIVLNVIQEEPPRPRKLRPGIPKDLETICMKALEKDPARRYRTADDLLRDIERFRAGEPIEARPSTFVYSVRKKINKHRELALAISAAVITICLVFMLLEHRTISAERELTSLREKERRTATKLEQELRRKEIERDVNQDKWRAIFDQPFDNSSMAYWIASGGEWKPLDKYLVASSEEPSSLEFADHLWGNLRVQFYFMLDARLKGHFGIAVSCLQDATPSGYRFLFLPDKLVLRKGDQVKKEVELTLRTMCQYKVTLLRQGDSLALSIDDKVVLSYRDPKPLTGKKCSRLRFMLSQGRVSVAELLIEQESPPLKGSPLVMADRLFMEGLFEPAIEVYRRVAEMPPSPEMAAEALYKMGLGYVKLENLPSAVECFKQVDALYGKSKHASSARLQLGLAYLRLRDYLALQQLLDEHGLDPFLHDVLREAPEDAISSYLAQLEFPAGVTDPDTRMQRLRELIILNNSLPEEKRDRELVATSLVELGQALLARDEHAEAANAFEEVIESYSDQFLPCFEARFRLADVRMTTGDYTAAADEYEGWLKDYTPEAIMRRVVRDVVRSEGRVVRVVASRRGWKFINNYVSKYGQVHRSLILIYSEQGKTRESIALLDSLAERLRLGARGSTAPDYILSRADRFRKLERWAQFWKGCFLVSQGSYDKALSSLDLAYHTPTMIGRSLPEPAATGDEQSDPRLAEGVFGIDEEMLDHNTRVGVMRYVIHMKLGNRADALKNLSAAFADNPTFFGPLTRGITDIFAMAVLPEEVPAAVPKNAGAYCYLAAVSLLAAKRKDEARALLLQGVEKKLSWPRFLLQEELTALIPNSSF
jgi:serine/threonine protein kinase/tetratricopeptide (TPR) repeat protein